MVSNSVRNYYKLDKRELDIAIEDIRKWLVYNKDNDQWRRAYFALKVALNAKELIYDDYTQLVINIVM